MIRDITNCHDDDKARITREVRDQSRDGIVWSFWSIDQDGHGTIIGPMVDIIATTRGEAMGEAIRFARAAMLDESDDGAAFVAWCEAQMTSVSFATGARYVHKWPAGETVLTVSRG